MKKTRMKNGRLEVFILLALCIFVPQTSEAHVLFSQENVGVIMHIDPADDPIVGRSATFYFDLKTKTGTLDLSLCECSIHISKEKRELASFPYATSLPYVFAEKGIYEVEVRGTPKSQSAFSPFSVKTDVRVSREALSGQNEPLEKKGHWIHFAAGGLAIAASLFLLIRDKIKRSRYNERV